MKMVERGDTNWGWFEALLEENENGSGDEGAEMVDENGERVVKVASMAEIDCEEDNLYFCSIKLGYLKPKYCVNDLPKLWHNIVLAISISI